MLQWHKLGQIAVSRSLCWPRYSVPHEASVVFEGKGNNEGTMAGVPACPLLLDSVPLCFHCSTITPFHLRVSWPNILERCCKFPRDSSCSVLCVLVVQPRGIRWGKGLVLVQCLWCVTLPSPAEFDGHITAGHGLPIMVLGKWRVGEFLWPCSNDFAHVVGSYCPSYEEMLRFYSYYKQATVGSCAIPRPGFWDPIGRYKW